MNAIECRGITKRYRDFSLDHVDLTLAQGSVLGFVGPNGAGKSTTIRIIMGLVHQDSGRATVLGHAMPQQQVAAKWNIGFVSEDMRLYGHRTIGFHLDFLRSIFPSWDDGYANTLLKRFELKPTQKVKGLSHGQRVKAALLTVFARKPQLLVLDEPTTGLDPVARKVIMEEMMKVMEDESRSVLFSSHNTLEVEQMCDHIVFINRGKVVANDDKEAFLDSWRRLRLVVGDEYQPPSTLPMVDCQRTGSQMLMTLSNYHPDLEQLVQASGAEIRQVERLTLEEIFVMSVESQREEKAAYQAEQEIAA